nr:PTS transporter subunit IIC [Enterococcus sp. MJM16]
MDNVLGILTKIMEAFGPSVVVPFVLFFIALALKVPVKKAFNSALSAGIGLAGFNMIITAFTPIVTPVVTRMVEDTGINLRVLDVGWQAASVVAYSTEVGMLFLIIGLLIQTVLFLTKFTNIFMPSDLWNNWQFMLWGSMVYLTTGNLWLAMGLMILQNLYVLVFCESIAKRWSKFYGYPRTVIVAPLMACTVPYAIVMDKVLNLFKLDKVKLNPEYLESKLGFLGEPASLGFILGVILGFFGNLTRLGELNAWGEMLILGISMAAVMSIFPKIAGIFAGAFSAITDASRKATKSGSKERVWYLGVNDAVGYGEPSTLLTGMLLIPIMLVIAIFLPGNQVLPMVDLIAIPYVIQMIMSVSKGNIAKGLISGALYFSIGLLTITAVAPIFTEVAIQTGVSIPAGAMLICSFANMSNPIFALLFFAFNSQSPLLIGLSVVVYLVLLFVTKTRKSQLENYLEQNNVEVEADTAA